MILIECQTAIAYIGPRRITLQRVVSKDDNV